MRDSNGAYKGPSPPVFEGQIQPKMLEVLACKEALCLSVEIVAQIILLASECQGAVRLPKKGIKCAKAHIIHDTGEVALFCECRDHL